MSGHVKGAIPIVCAMLAGKFGVPIRWSDAATEHTDGTYIGMPDLPAQGRDTAAMAYGFVAHGAGHVRFTDFTALPVPDVDRVLFDVINILEDPRIELAMCGAFPGARMWFNDLTQALVSEGKLGGGLDEPVPGLVRAWLLHRSSVDVMEYQCLVSYADKQSNALRAAVGDEVMDRLYAALKESYTCRATAEVVTVARKVLEILREAVPELDEGWGTGPSDKGDIALAALRTESAAMAQKRVPLLRVPTVDVDERRLDGTPLLEIVRGQTTALRARLSELIEDQAIKRHRSARTGRRPRADASVRLLRGNLRVFDRRESSDGIDVAIYALLDKSSSMSIDGRITEAKKALLMLLMALDDVEGVQTAASSFPHTLRCGVGLDEAGVVELKGFAETYRLAAGRLNLVEACGDTPMAAALQHAHAELLGQPRLRKIVMALHDGKPTDEEATLAVIASGEEAGIEHIGIGIGADVDHLFARSYRVEQAQELPMKLAHIAGHTLFGDLAQAA